MATRMIRSKAKPVLIYDPAFDKRLKKHEMLVKEFLKKNHKTKK